MLPLILLPLATLITAAPLIDLPAPISRWDEAIPLGNGRLGALVWGEGSTLKFSLDRADLWDTRVPQIFTSPDWTYANMVKLKEEKNHARHVELFDKAYDTIPYPTKLPGGRLEIQLPEGTTIKRFILHAPIGSADITFQGTDTATVAVDPDNPVLLITSLPSSAGIKLVNPAGLTPLGYPPARVGSDDHSRWFVQSNADNSFTWAVFAAIPGANDTGSCGTFAVAIATSRDSKNPLAAAAKLATRAVCSAAEILPKVEARYEKLATPQVKLPDPDIQRQYDLCRYWMIAGSQPDSPPMPLQGIWTADEGGLPPWKGDYHNDLNTQTTYIAYQAADMLSEGSSFTNFLWNLTPRFQKFAKDFYNVDGLVVPGVMGIDGAPLGGWGQYSLSPTHTAWLAQTFYLHWRYSMDDKFLADRAYPWCSQAGTALAALLKPDASGHLLLPLSTSPEIHDNSPGAWLTPNSNYDNALLMYLFDINEKMARALHNDADAARWKKLASQLPPLDTEADGTLTFARNEPFKESHRHFSHAMAIHPLGLVNIEGSPRDREIIEATLARTQSLGTKAWCGYSFSWFSAMNARAGHADAAADYLKKFCTSFVSRNGFHLNGDQSGTGLSGFTYRPFTLEGNFLAMHAVHEMLLQSWGDTIRIFPAVPDAWKDVSFRNLLAEGAVEVSATRIGGKTTSVTLKPRRPVTVRVLDPFSNTRAVQELHLETDAVTLTPPAENAQPK